MMYYTLHTTPAGDMLLTGDGETITGMYWTVFRRAPRVGADWIENKATFSDATTQLDEYFAGARQAFDLKFAYSGTLFQESVWRELQKIPFGVSTSYQAIAEAIGKPKAVRAVGTAVGSNPVCIVVPCHRVLATSGKLGGYAGGLDGKRVLLKTERIAWKEA
jgi:methylated-DNA-[protein]-cysteine S-methyltransferase